MTKTKKATLFLALASIVILYAVVNNLKKDGTVIPSPNKLRAINYYDSLNSRYEIPISDSPMDFTAALTSDVNKWPTYRNEQ